MSSDRLTILAVDDERTPLDDLARILRASLVVEEVECACDAHDALTRLAAHPFDGVFLDVRMPGLDGVQVLRKIREINGDVPVIMVTANEDVSLAKETLKLGAFDYVAKPFDFDYLDRAVAAGLARAGEKAPAGHAPEDDPWKRLARAAFGAARAMQPLARTSTGERIETAALAAARNAAAGRCAVADEHLAEMQLLLDVAAEFGDLPAADRALVESALEAARRSLQAAG